MTKKHTREITDERRQEILEDAQRQTHLLALLKEIQGPLPENDERLRSTESKGTGEDFPGDSVSTTVQTADGRKVPVVIRADLHDVSELAQKRGIIGKEVEIPGMPVFVMRGYGLQEPGEVSEIVGYRVFEGNFDPMDFGDNAHAPANSMELGDSLTIQLGEPFRFRKVFSAGHEVKRTIYRKKPLNA